MQDQIKLAQFNYELQKSLVETKSAVEREQLETEGWADQQKLYNATSNDKWSQVIDRHKTDITAAGYNLENRTLMVKEFAGQMEGYLTSAVQSGGMTEQHAAELRYNNTLQVINQAYPDAVIIPVPTPTGVDYKIKYTPTKSDMENKYKKGWSYLIRLNSSIDVIERMDIPPKYLKD